jgi:hypothetical protein
MSELTLMDIIQLHERKWGEHQYPNRPALSTLMTARIVAMWKTGNRFILSAHETAEDINAVVLAIITGKDPNPLNKKLLKLFVRHQVIPFEIRIVAIDNQSTSTNDPDQNSDRPHFLFAKRNKVTGKPAAYVPQGSNDGSLPGRNVSPLSGRRVKLQHGREVPVVKTATRSKKQQE